MLQNIVAGVEAASISINWEQTKPGEPIQEHEKNREHWQLEDLASLHLPVTHQTSCDCLESLPDATSLNEWQWKAVIFLQGAVLPTVFSANYQCM